MLRNVCSQALEDQSRISVMSAEDTGSRHATTAFEMVPAADASHVVPTASFLGCICITSLGRYAIMPLTSFMRAVGKLQRSIRIPLRQRLRMCQMQLSSYWCLSLLSQGNAAACQTRSSVTTSWVWSTTCGCPSQTPSRTTLPTTSSMATRCSCICTLHIAFPYIQDLAANTSAICLDAKDRSC